MTSTQPVSIRLDEELLEEFDDTIWYLEMQGDLPRRTSRSDIVRELIEEWLEENKPEDMEGNSKTEVAPPTLS
jgi:metal-responsive CopG/Arc/MetJ family transcriptional regulator